MVTYELTTAFRANGEREKWFLSGLESDMEGEEQGEWSIGERSLLCSVLGNVPVYTFFSSTVCA